MKAIYLCLITTLFVVDNIITPANGKILSREEGMYKIQNDSVDVIDIENDIFVMLTSDADDYFKGYWDWNRWEETAKDSLDEDFMQNWLDRGEDLQELITREERAFVRQEADRQNICRDTFVDLYQNWRERWLISPSGEKLPEVVIDWEGRKVWLNSPGEGASRRLVDPRSLPEFSRLAGMGEKVIPLVMELMMDNPDENFVLLLLYEELSENDFVKVAGFMSEPMRAVRTVKAWIAGKK